MALRRAPPAAPPPRAAARRRAPPAASPPRAAARRPPALALAAGAAALACLGSGCDDPERFSTEPGEAYCGAVVQGAFVRSGFGPAVQMRLTFDTARIESGPGALSTSDGLLLEAPLRPLEPFFHDALSSLQFGEGRERSLLYFVDPAGGGAPLTAFVSLMEGGDVEVRLVRAAAAPPPEPPPEGAPAPLFGVFPLKRRNDTCGF
ncbi:MAG TPA: hypothetical protein VFS43_28575 [Polyangiaceae bacterium]|nr:hypothetical protein [Polyangiaceae bacterium]